jgi:feruloyl esterase
VKDTAAADAQIGGSINAINPDLSRLKKRGTKLIQFHGATDPAIPFQESVDYYKGVQAKMGDTSGYYRLFVVPGMLHCGGGAGPTAADWLGALQGWVEQGVAPDRVVARFTPPGPPGNPFAPPGPPAPDAASRPLCPYPAVAKYSGSGDPKQAASYACVGGRKAAAARKTKAG